MDSSQGTPISPRTISTIYTEDTNSLYNSFTPRRFDDESLGSYTPRDRADSTVSFTSYSPTIENPSSPQAIHGDVFKNVIQNQQQTRKNSTSPTLVNSFQKFTSKPTQNSAIPKPKAQKPSSNSLPASPKSTGAINTNVTTQGQIDQNPISRSHSGPSVEPLSAKVSYRSMTPTGERKGRERSNTITSMGSSGSQPSSIERIKALQENEEVPSPMIERKQSFQKVSEIDAIAKKALPAATRLTQENFTHISEDLEEIKKAKNYFEKLLHTYALKGKEAKILEYSLVNEKMSLTDIKTGQTDIAIFINRLKTYLPNYKKRINDFVKTIKRRQKSELPLYFDTSVLNLKEIELTNDKFLKETCEYLKDFCSLAILLKNEYLKIRDFFQHYSENMEKEQFETIKTELTTRAKKIGIDSFQFAEESCRQLNFLLETHISSLIFNIIRIGVKINELGVQKRADTDTYSHIYVDYIKATHPTNPRKVPFITTDLERYLNGGFVHLYERDKETDNKKELQSTSSLDRHKTLLRFLSRLFFNDDSLNHFNNLLLSTIKLDGTDKHYFEKVMDVYKFLKNDSEHVGAIKNDSKLLEGIKRKVMEDHTKKYSDLLSFDKLFDVWKIVLQVCDQNFLGRFSLELKWAEACLFNEDSTKQGAQYVQIIADKDFIEFRNSSFRTFNANNDFLPSAKLWEICTTKIPKVDLTNNSIKFDHSIFFVLEKIHFSEDPSLNAQVELDLLKYREMIIALGFDITEKK